MDTLHIESVPCGSDPVKDILTHLTVKKDGAESDGFASFEGEGFALEIDLDGIEIIEEKTEAIVRREANEPNDEDLGQNQYAVPSRTGGGWLVKQQYLTETEVTLRFTALPAFEADPCRYDGPLDIVIDGHTVTYDESLLVSHELEIPTDEIVRHEMTFCCIGEGR